MLALGITIALAIVGGACTGLILKIPFLDNLTRDECYEDSVFWEVNYRLLWVVKLVRLI